MATKKSICFILAGLFSLLYLSTSFAQIPVTLTLNFPSSVQDTAMTFTWDEYAGGDFSEYLLFRDTTGSVDTNDQLVQTISSIATTSYTDNSLHVITKYFYKLYVKDAAGTFVAASNEVDGTTLANPYPFYDNVEGNVDNRWTVSSGWGLSDVNPYSGTYSWTDSPGGNYDNNASNYLLLRLDLSTSQLPVLKFFTRYTTQANYDHGRVEVSTDGSNWTVAGYFSGSQSTWKKILIDLTTWQGVTDLWVRWRFTSNSSTVSDGWYIDDISVNETPVLNLPYPFVESFNDTGSYANWHFSQWDLVSNGIDGTLNLHDSPRGFYLASGGTETSDNPNSFSSFVSSGVFDLSGAVDPVLIFHQKYDLWSTTASDRPEHDYGRIYISTSKGQPGTWVNLYNVSGTDHTEDWERVEIDLSDYLLPNVRFKFVVDDQRDQNTYHGDQSVVRDGWWLDNIRIENRPASTQITSLTGVTMHGAVINWQLNVDSDFSRYEIYRSTSENVDRNSQLIAEINDQNVTAYHDNYQILRPQKYYYRIYVIDTLETVSKGSNISSADYTVPTTSFPFTDSVEVAADTLNWAWGYPWGRTNSKAHSGNYSWTDSPNASYSPNTNSALSFNINLSGSSSPVLSFWHQYSIETNNDYGYVEISIDNGNTWSIIHTVTGFDAEWSMERIELTDYIGSTIGLRFRLYSNDAAHSDGWWIDDIIINDGQLIADYPFYEGFETGFERWFVNNPWGLTSNNPHGGSYAFTDSPAGTYADNSSTSLLLHINLSDAQIPLLTFWGRFSTQVNVDYLRVEISIDGTNWDVIGYWTGSQSAWREYRIDLTPWQGSSDVRIRWRLTSNESIVSDGWYIDDINIYESPQPVISYPFLEFFDDSTFFDIWHTTQWDLKIGGIDNTNSIHDSPQGNYLASGGTGTSDNPNSITGITTSNVIDLSGSVDPVLTFYEKHDIWYSTASDRPEHDYGRVWISSDFGLPGTWTQLYTVTGATDDPAWQKVEIDLSEYANSKVRLKFLLDDQRDQNTYHGDQSVVRNGWWIDDIRVENRPRVVTIADPADASMNGVTLNWSQNTDTDFDYYAIFRSLSEDVDLNSELITVIDNQSTISYRDNYQITRPNVYSYRIYVYDTLATPSKGSNIITAAYTVPTDVFPLVDMVSEFSDTLWAYSYPWGIIEKAGHTGLMVWTDSPGASYAPNANTVLTTNVNLSGSNTPVLSFWHKYSFESSVDFGYVELSTDNGNNWFVVHSVTGVDTSWNEERVNLAAYVGSTIGLRFRVLSNETNHLDGWYIDDITILDGRQIVSYPFFDDMESGISNWFIDSPWGLTETNPYSGNYSWTDSPAGSYADNSNNSLLLRIDLSTAQMPVLKFMTHYATQVNHDYCRVEVSTDGSNWTVAGYWSGSLSTWKLIKVDLTPWQGASDVRIRWRFVSDGSSTSDGWYIDDVSVNETLHPYLAYPFYDDFEDSLSNNRWHFSQWEIVTEGYNSNGRVHDSPTGNYLPSGGTGTTDNPNSFTSITTSGVLDLSAAENPVLSFYQKTSLWYSTNSDRPEYDYGRIYISTNYGLPGTWTQIYQITGTNANWERVTIDLNAYKLPNVRFRFVVDDQRDQNTYHGDQSVTLDGWWIDKIAIHNNYSNLNIPDVVFLEEPAQAGAIPFVPTERIYGLVYEPGITDQAGKGENILAEVGFGDDGSLPDDSTWLWFPASYLNDEGEYDRYFASLTADTLGTFDYAYRFKVGEGEWVYADLNGNDLGAGGFNSYESEYAGDLLVSQEPDIEISISELGITLPVNVIDNRTFTIKNNGPGKLRFNLVESDSLPDPEDINGTCQ
ncbi:MAG: hypothetical protein K9J16_14085 [Melioribacteraceae bacterium]|nr:hypothetical protein [Melioribacteraceae bacterium]MCF8396195.1 hypothetical protein [Melioribacteraceae bacterium]MCF8420537.1 hypothetical protein [Melioribacteraceae bacterium]